MIIFSVPLVDDFPYKILRSHEYNYLELRMDYVNNFQQETLLLNKVKSSLPPSIGNRDIIITLREAQEGGVSNRLTPHQKKIKLERYSSQDKFLIDCELDFFIKYKPKLKATDLLLSKHIYHTDSKIDIKNIVTNTIDGMSNIKAYMYKIVVPINSYSELNYYLNLQQSAEIPIIIQGTGMLGKLFRIIRYLKGFKGSYVSLGSFKTAKEQLTFDDMGIFSQLCIEQETIIGGIIGKEDLVYKSLGLQYYNRLFKDNEINGVYLPFPVEDQEDFFNWLEIIQHINKLYGFSITMPLKNNLSNRFRNVRKPVNLMSVLSNKTQNIERHIHNNNTIDSQLPYNNPELFFNTDQYAMRRSFEALNVRAEERIIIFGYGGTAETALMVSVSFKNVYLTGRNLVKGSIVAKKYGRRFIEIERLSEMSFDLIINCSPLGRRNEDFMRATGLNGFKKTIDLPYINGSTPLIQYCRGQKIPYVSGKLFWQWQSINQEKVFIDNISLHRQNINEENKE